MVRTCKVPEIKRKLNDPGVAVSLGRVMSLNPFFIIYPTDKELSLCLCKLHLDLKMLLDPLMPRAKKGDVNM